MDKEQLLTELVENVKLELGKMQYEPKYLKGLYSHLNSILFYAQEMGIDVFSDELGYQYLYQRYGIVKGVSTNKAVHAQRAVNALIEYSRNGRIALRITKGKTFPQHFKSEAESYIKKLEQEFKRPKTILRHKIKLMRFLEYLNELKIQDISRIDVNTVNKYFTERCRHYCKHGLRDNIYIVSNFLHTLHDMDILKDDFTDRLVHVAVSYVPQHIPDAFSDDELSKILSSVDRANPVGKRNYAILLLAAKLGLRTSDIRALRPDNIDWDNHEINIIQLKTGQPLTLPLPSDVGWAIIDYLQNGRPPCDTEEIFVRFRSPFTPLSNYNAILSKHMCLAGIRCDKFRHHGMHTMRSSLASKLLRENVSLRAIQTVLGHANIESTNIYTGVDLNQLEQCSLEVPTYD